MSIGRTIVVSCTLMQLAACSFGVPLGQRAGDGGSLVKTKAGNPSSYVVMGKRYYVMDSASGFHQRGVASWYGPDFHGKKTSSGESYNMHAMTAAHKTLPIPVLVRVKNLDNGKSVVVRVNDRGPFVDDRIIDLSYAAAQKLDMVGPGTARVEITALEPNGKAALSHVRTVALQPAADEQDIYIQLGAFSSKNNAAKLRDKLLASNEKAIVIRSVATDSGQIYRVQLGPLLDVAEAESVQLRLKRKGYEKARIVIN